jgi:hypothetical protein
MGRGGGCGASIAYLDYLDEVVMDLPLDLYIEQEENNDCRASISKSFIKIPAGYNFAI